MQSVVQSVSSRLQIHHQAQGANGPQLVCICPFCGGDKKLWVNAQSGLWICYKCGEKGNLARLLWKIDGRSRANGNQFSYPISWNNSVSWSDVSEPLQRRWKPEPSRMQSRQEDVVKLPDEYIPVHNVSTGEWRIPKMLERRGIPPEVAASYRVGFCRSGQYAGRLILPCMIRRRIVGYQARAMGPSCIKYLTQGSKHMVFGWDQAVWSDSIVVVEGPFDVLGLARWNVPAVALLGKQCSKEKAKLIASMGVRKATVMLDHDVGAGMVGGRWRDRRQVAMALAKVGLDVTVALLPPGRDPGDATQEEVQQALQEAR